MSIMRQNQKALLKKHGVTLTAVAEELDLTVSFVGSVMAGRFSSARVVAAVAAKVGMEPEAFATRYIPKYRRVEAA